jgi:hypothetical protein
MRQIIDWITRIPWKLLARWALVVYAIVLISLSGAGIVLFPAYAKGHAAEFLTLNSWSAEKMKSGLSQLGWPVITLAYADLARSIYLLAAGGSVGLLLLWKKSGDWFGLYLAFAFLSFSSGIVLFVPLIERLPWLITVNDYLGSASWQLFFIIFYFFPNGRAEPRWVRWIGFGWLVSIFVKPFVPGLLDNFWSSPLAIVFPLSAMGSQIYRYLRRSNTQQRQQTKWLVGAVGAMLIAIIPLLMFFDPPLQESSLGIGLAAAMSSLLLFNFAIGLVPLSIAAAIFRYRLWDIDLIIRRTLVYAVLSGLLGLVYFGSVVLLRQLLSGVTGNSSVAIVLSTLLIFFLFSPLRRALQEGIDRRFFRRKYDAVRALAEFSAVARDEVQLEAISSKLVAVVSETIQPESLSLWMRPQKDGRRKEAARER